MSKKITINIQNLVGAIIVVQDNKESHGELTKKVEDTLQSVLRSTSSGVTKDLIEENQE